MARAIILVTLVLCAALVVAAEAQQRIPATCFRVAKVHCAADRHPAAVRACLDNLPVHLLPRACASAMSASATTQKARGNLRRKLIKEAPTWTYTIPVDNSAGGGTKNAIIAWNILDPTTPIVEAAMSSPSANWLGVGFSPNGGMGGSVAVVYRPDNNAGEEVQVTFIADKHENAFILIDQSDLTVHSFGQDQNGSMMHFTANLSDAPVDTNPDAPTDVIWAIGASNTFRFDAGYHGTDKGTFPAVLNPTNVT